VLRTLQCYPFPVSDSPEARPAGDLLAVCWGCCWMGAGGLLGRDHAPPTGTTDSGGGMHSLSLVPDTYSLSLERANSQFAYRSPVLSIEPCSPPGTLSESLLSLDTSASAPADIHPTSTVAVEQ